MQHTLTPDTLDAIAKCLLVTGDMPMQMDALAALGTGVIVVAPGVTPYDLPPSPGLVLPFPSTRNRRIDKAIARLVTRDFLSAQPTLCAHAYVGFACGQVFSCINTEFLCPAVKR